MLTDKAARIGVLVSSFVVTAIGVGVMVGSSFGNPDVENREYWGARVLSPGPAVKGLPLIPVRVEADGTLSGVPTHLSWYRYCGHEDSPGTSYSFQGPNSFSYYTNREKVLRAKAEGVNLWWENSLGKAVRANDFPGLWKGAPVEWRSEGQRGEDVITAVVIRVDPMAYPDKVRSEFVRDGFVAVTTSVTHMCCVAGYEEQRSVAARYREGDGYPVIYDSCHDNRYNPRQVRSYELPALDPTGFP